jgi:DnaJ-domain-containing protein 1
MTVWAFAVTMGCGVAGFWLVSIIIDAFLSKPQTDQGAPNERDEHLRTKHKSTRQPAWFEILGVPSTASMDEIKSAYRELARQYHPDRVQGLGEEFRTIAERKMKELNSAYQDALRMEVGARPSG